MSALLLILGLVLFIGLVIVHEFGHFLIARRSGVEVEEFGIGFPPRIWSKKLKAGFRFSLNWLPIGGFVKLKGENDADKRPGSFGAASLGVKAKIALAGVAMNLVVAFFLFTFLALVGMPQLVDNQFTVASDTKLLKQEVLIGLLDANSPASRAGLRAHDQILSLQNNQIVTAKQLQETTKSLAGQSIQIVYARAGHIQTGATKLRTTTEVEASQKQGKTIGYLGVAPAEFTLKRSTWSAPIVALGMMKQFTVLTFQGLGRAIGALLQGDGARASSQVAGPVGIVVVLKDGSFLGYQFILLIIGVISLTLAIMNILPIPALDGGRLFVLILARLFGRQLSQEMEERIVGASFIFLLFLIALITVADVKRFF